MATDPPFPRVDSDPAPDRPEGVPAVPRRPLHLRLGTRGEDAACALLQASGYRVLTRNYHCRSGEIDIVALDGQVLVFVEVKSRTASRYGSPRDAVTPAKRRKMARTASHYMLAHMEQECAYRADIIEVGVLHGAVAAVRHLQGAFSIEAELEKLSG